MSRLSTLFYLGAGLVFGSLGSAQASEIAAVCKPILADGVFNTRSTKTAWDNYQRISSLYCSGEAETHSQAKDLKIEGSAMIKGILYGLGYGDTENDYASFRNELCNSEDKILSKKGWLNENVSQASMKILDTYNECIKLQTDGVFMRLKDYSRESPDFTLNFKNSLSAANSKIEINLFLPANIECSSAKAGRGEITGEIKLEVTHAGLTLFCTRLNCSSGLLGVSKSDYAVSPTSIRMPAIHTPPTRSAEKVVHYETSEWHSASSRWSKEIPNTAKGETCTLSSTEGVFNCSGNNNNCPRQCKEVVGISIQGNVESASDFDPGYYADNFGYCRSTFKCEKPIVAEASPHLPAFCSKP